MRLLAAVMQDPSQVGGYKLALRNGAATAGAA